MDLLHDFILGTVILAVIFGIPLMPFIIADMQIKEDNRRYRLLRELDHLEWLAKIEAGRK